MTFTVSIEHLYGEFVLCPLGDYPDGFMDIGGFDTVEEAEAWLTKWAESRRLRISVIQPRQWQVQV